MHAARLKLWHRVVARQSGWDVLTLVAAQHRITAALRGGPPGHEGSFYLLANLAVGGSWCYDWILGNHAH
jgi:hypothetical protein